MRTTLAHMQQRLSQSSSPFEVAFAHGTMSVELYRPDQVDAQNPHDQDELYVIMSGSGTFINGSDRHPFSPGDVLFVRAGVAHRFVDFTEDFETWVIFYGPKGGES